MRYSNFIAVFTLALICTSAEAIAAPFTVDWNGRGSAGGTLNMSFSFDTVDVGFVFVDNTDLTDFSANIVGGPNDGVSWGLADIDVFLAEFPTFPGDPNFVAITTAPSTTAPNIVTSIPTNPGGIYRAVSSETPPEFFVAGTWTIQEPVIPVPSSGLMLLATVAFSSLARRRRR